MYAMKFGLQLPNLGPFADVQLMLQLAQRAEAAGWDGFFLWDHVAIPDRMADSTTLMAALAVVTQRMRLGVLVTAPSRRRPWKLAREWTTLDHLSNGRAVLGVGLGASEYDFEHCHEDAALNIRAQRLDEALTIVDGLWSGREFTYHGQHFQVDQLRFSRRRYSSRAFQSGWRGFTRMSRRCGVRRAGMACSPFARTSRCCQMSGSRFCARSRSCAGT